ncbi:MAG: hypothetical protein GXO15_04075 [Crenarchaeota archaeon]|nr:hypothetical protein [Thermoproteota archaeon]
MSGGSFEERVRKLLEKIRSIKEQLEDVALDEMSEAHAYMEMAKLCGDDETRWSLFLIALDSLLHREIAWALLRALAEAETLAKEVTVHAKAGGVDREKLAELVKMHRSIEEFAESSYRGLVELAEPGTTLRKLLELLAEEEVKHERLVDAVLQRLGSGRGGGC